MKGFPVPQKSENQSLAYKYQYMDQLHWPQASFSNMDSWAPFSQ